MDTGRTGRFGGAGYDFLGVLAKNVSRIRATLPLAHFGNLTFPSSYSLSLPGPNELLATGCRLVCTKKEWVLFSRIQDTSDGFPASYHTKRLRTSS